jgi:hypothetical protein
MITALKNGWSEGEATEDGIYLRATDEWEDDEDGEEFQFIAGKWLKEGASWFCYGGVWKRVADLPNDPKLSDGGAWRGSCGVERRESERA